MQKLILFLCTLMSTTWVQAQPVLYPDHLSTLSSIRNETNSNLVADLIDHRRFYVMPPNAGYSIVSGLHSLTTNIGFCREMGDLQNYSRLTTGRIHDLSEKEEEKLEEYTAYQKTILAARQQLADFANSENMQPLFLIDERMATIEARIHEILNIELKECKDHCSTLRKEYNELSAQRRVLANDRRTLVRENTQQAREYEKRKLRVEAEEKHLEDLKNEYANLYERLSRTKSQFIQMYQDFGALEGARASIRFDSQWNENISTLRAENPGISFEKIATQNAQITSSIANLDSIPTGGAILSYHVGGNTNGQYLELPSYPEDLTGNVRLSLIGTCPVVHPSYFDINLPTGTDEMRYGLIVSYEYPTIFNANVTMKYNMKKMYEKIVQSSSRGGGFFRKRRSTTSIEEKSTFKDSFNVVWHDAIGLSDEDKDLRENEMRERVFLRLANLGLPKVITSNELQLPSVPASGALVLAQGIEKNCPNNIYCKGASVVIGFLDAMFGSTSATSIYRNLQDVEIEDKWSKSEMIWRPWITSYN